MRPGRRARFAALALRLLGLLAAPVAQAYDPRPWLKDLEQVRTAFATKYANLEWAVFEQEIDLQALFAATRSQVATAGSDVEARLAFDRLARRFGDGHVGLRWPALRRRAASTTTESRCNDLGFDARMRSPEVATLLPGYAALETPVEFPAGIVLTDGHRLGVIAIGSFTPKAYPALCRAALEALAPRPAERCDAACVQRIDDWTAARMTDDLARALRALRDARAEVLLVDVIGNGGGTEWAQAAARMLTPVRLHSFRRGVVRGPHWSAAFARDERALRAAARAASAEDRALLTALADEVAGRRRAVATPCDSAPLWRGERPGCEWLATGFYATGLLDAADPAALRDKPWRSLVFSPMQYPYAEGVWNGPLVIAVDSATASAAEGFAETLQANHAALVVGAPTAGGGCGRTNGGTPTRLTHSRAVLELPDCAELRADASNRNSGVVPDQLLELRAQDGPHRLAWCLARHLDEIISRAYP